MGEDRKSTEIDESLYSRQLYVLGEETMQALGKMNVLIVGLNGLGAEIAKCVILAGPKSVTLLDNTAVSVTDLSSQFYLSESDIGSQRAAACHGKMAELNPYVQVRLETNEFSLEMLEQYQVVVMVDVKDSRKLVEANEFCRTHLPTIKFVHAECRGLCAKVFVDFGPSFVVTDGDGEEPLNYIVSGISQSNPGIVTIHEESRLSLETGDFVVFEEIKGMAALNEHEPQKIKRTGPHTFEICDTTSMGAFEGTGMVYQKKTPKQISFLSLQESLKKPEMIINDFAKMERPGQLHLGFQALLKYQDTHNGDLPAHDDESQIAEVLESTKALNESSKKEGTFSVDAVDEKLIQQLAKGSRGDLSPMCAFIGGIVAQEVLKSSGKFTPISQWFYFDALECLPDTVDDAILTGSRYDHSVLLFGQAFQKRLADLRLFLVGAGALGCDLLKNFAMMGIGTNKEGQVFVTDMDNIEKSNLNRQFLFRDKDIGNMKSTVAAAATKAMNADVNIKSSETPVGLDTEDTFHDDFWESFDLVVNALDNLKARLYVDSKCVIFNKPLLESGTMGTKANTQVILPMRTESYGSSSDPPEKSIPMCTIKNFPHAIEHTIEWARDQFAGLFFNTVSDVLNFAEQPDYLKSLQKQQPNPAQQRETLSGIYDMLLASTNITFTQCIEMARLKFEEFFTNRIKQLLYNFPLDHVTSSGIPFWSGPKRPPVALKFDPSNEVHMGFVIAAANLYAFNFKIDPSACSKDPSFFKKALESISVPHFEPKKGVRIQADEKDNTEEGEDDDDKCVDELVEKLKKYKASSASFSFQPAKFEKDDDSNFHIDFITATSNLRASNYGIKLAGRNKTKKIAGRIIPAIATTTAMVTGLVCLELYKVIQASEKDIDQFKNAFINLALPFWTFSEPIAPPKIVSDPSKCMRAYPEGWTLWDSLVVDEGDITLQGLLDYFKNNHKLIVSSIACGSSLVYNAYLPKYKERLPRKVVSVWEEISKKKVPGTAKYLDLVIEFEDEDDDDLEIETPLVRFKFK